MVVQQAVVSSRPSLGEAFLFPRRGVSLGEEDSLGGDLGTPGRDYVILEI